MVITLFSTVHICGKLFLLASFIASSVLSHDFKINFGAVMLARIYFVLNYLFVSVLFV